MEDRGQDVWARAKEVIKAGLNLQSFETWFGPTKQVTMEGDEITVGVPNKFFKEWLTDHYRDLIRGAVNKVAGRSLNINLVIQPQYLHEEGPPPSVKRDLPTKYMRLNPKYSFESFVVGSGNRFAHAASLAVAQSPAKAYNPLFIYGRVGLGKTHLLQAIAQHILARDQNVKVFYVSSEVFTNQLIRSIQNRTTLQFRQRYRNVDCLLIDDVHFISGKQSTQEEFFHTFNTLYDAHKQIVVSSDRPPKEIPALEERLVSRFEWGLVTDIQPPDLETRIAILRKKAEREVVGVPDDVTFFLANRIKSNIRELEGALIRVIAYSSLVGGEVTVDLAKDVLKDALIDEEKKITIDLIQEGVAKHFNINVSDMRAKKRTKAIAYPRQIAMYLVRNLTNYSLPEIGEYFGGRDHTTILYACSKVRAQMEEDQRIKDLVNTLVFNIKK